MNKITIKIVSTIAAFFSLIATVSIYYSDIGVTESVFAGVITLILVLVALFG